MTTISSDAAGVADRTNQTSTALDLAARGLPVFPLYEPTDAGCACPKGANCPSPGKHPRSQGWQQNATTDADTITKTWARHPTANIGIRTGDGVYVVDVDGPDAQRAFDALDLAPTLTVTTGRGEGGRHYYFRAPADAVLRNAAGTTIAKGIEGRGDGGYVVAPGSVHATGTRYTVAEDRELAELAPALVDQLKGHRDTASPRLGPDDLAAFRAAAQTLPEAERDELAREAGRCMADVIRDLGELPRGSGHDRGNKFYGAAWNLGEYVGAGVLDVDKARAVLESAASRLELPRSHHVWRSIERGLAQGAAAPAVMLADFGPSTAPTVGTATNTPSGGSIFARQRVPLGERMRKGIPEVEWLPSPRLGERLFYAHNVALLAGHKKAGKSWCMLIQAADMMAAGRPVVYIDQENGWELFVERLLQLGVDPKVAEDLCVYVPFATERPTLATLRQEIVSLAQEFPGALIVLDSLRTFLSHYGLSPNTDVDVERFLGPIMGAVKGLPVEHKVTVCVIDHSNRKTAEGDQYAAAGSFAKAAAVDAVYFFSRQERFSSTQRGLVKMIAVDDRRGLLEFERFYRIGGQGEGEPFFFEQADATEVGGFADARESVRRYLVQHEGQQFTQTAIEKADGVTGKAQFRRNALAWLVASDPHVYEDPNRGRRGSLYCYDSSRDPDISATVSTEEPRI